MTKVFVVIETMDYDYDENLCGNSFNIIGVFTNLERAKAEANKSGDRDIE